MLLLANRAKVQMRLILTLKRFLVDNRPTGSQLL